ncbi:fasciclin domain-containing protein [Vannielia litorea]|uniref:fasciclin domain-containing protein n=1 Tax=Vannielia litorea TaxID=1217970 RepID=UPI001BCCC6A2|nr:fasciclin domain-containing protein [Vannielia litorea]MBS8225834.1 fasciclin domain-containing protein [Vannielia litorea]
MNIITLTKAAVVSAALAVSGCTTTGSSSGPDIVEVAQSTGSFETLVAAVSAAGLVETLQGPGPYTVFAPTDEAFAALPAGTLDDLLKPENRDTLTAILTYHVVPGVAEASDLAGRRVSVLTANGGKLRIDGTRGGVRVNDAMVVSADVQASNGVIHVIDKVLLP